MNRNIPPLPTTKPIRSLIIALLFLCPSIRAYSQPGKEKSLSGYKHATVRLPPSDSVPGARQTSLFQHFEVIDERPDTARIGLHFRYTWDSYRQLTLGHPVREELAAYLDKHFARPDAPYTALIVLRKLWLSNVYYFEEENPLNPDTHLEKIRLRLRAEVYAARDGVYTPLFRFDSVAVTMTNSYSRWGYDLVGMLNDLADSASLVTTRKAGKGRSLRLEEIEQFNHSRFSILTDTSIVRTRGVYASFNEFRNNEPSIQDFLVREVKDKTRLYIKNAAGEMTYSPNAWGYCDGKDIFVMKDGILYRTWREGKGYYFYYEEDDGRHPHHNGAYVPPLSPYGEPPAHGIFGNSGKVDCIFAVDMDTGDIY